VTRERYSSSLDSSFDADFMIAGRIFRFEGPLSQSFDPISPIR